MSSTRGRIRILHIITNLPVGGAQDNTLITVERLHREYFDVTLMCSPEGEWIDRARGIKDLNLIFINELTRRIRILKDVKAFFKIYRTLKQGDYTIVHTHSSKPGVLGRIAAKFAGVPVIIHTIHGFPFHDFMSPLLRHLLIRMERMLSKLTDRLVTVSTLNLEKANRLRLADPSKLVNIYSGIDFNRFDIEVDKEAKKRELGVCNGEKVVGLVGRLSAQKAPLDFVRAIPEVLRKKRDVRFVVVGDGELRHEVEQLSRTLGIDSEISILGFRDDVAEILPTFDVYVLTSLWEGLGRSLTEAMYVARPVVATNVEGVPELVKNGETGILVEPKDVHSIANGIATLLTDEQEARRLGRAAKNCITDSFSADVMVRQLESVYHEVLLNKGIKPESEI